MIKRNFSGWLTFGASCCIAMTLIASCAQNMEAPEPEAQAVGANIEAPDGSFESDAGGMSTDANSESSLEEIIVVSKASPGGGDGHDVPVAFGVITAADLDDSGIRDIRDLRQITPGLAVGQSRYAMAVSSGVQYMGGPDPQMAAAALISAHPGEELWIIAAPPADAGGPDDDDELGSGAMIAHLSVPDDEPDALPQKIPLPLKHTSVRAVIDGYVGTVDVTQKFENPFNEKIEAVYMFPLPQKAAVSEFVMTIG